MAKKKTAADAEIEVKEANETVGEESNPEKINTSAESVTEETPKKGKVTDTAKIYVGVSLPGIPSNTVFNGKIPEKLNAPFVRELVIPIDEFTDFIKKKSVTDSREAFCYRKSAEYARELKK